MSNFSVSDLGFDQFARQMQLAGAERELATPEPGISRDQLHEAASAFEQILVGFMMEAMRESIPDGGLLPETPGHDLYEQMFYHEAISQGESRTMQLGLAEAIERQFADLVREANTTVEETGADATTAEAGAESPSDTPQERRTAGI